VHGAFERRNVVFEVVPLARKLVLRTRDARVAPVDECVHGALDVLCFLCACDRPRHGEQCRIPARDAFFVRDADLELHACVLVEVIEAREDRLQCGGRQRGRRWKCLKCLAQPAQGQVAVAERPLQFIIPVFRPYKFSEEERRVVWL
jgi:hypothetical protein